MNKPIKRLGRGLDSLISRIPARDVDPATARTVSPNADSPAAEGAVGQMVETSMLPVESLRRNKFQPRHNIANDEILSLAQSIRQSGMLQPISVRRNDGGFEIIAGERRWAAAKSIGWETVPVIIREASDEQMLELALIENIQREDLNPIDRAKAYREFCDRFRLSPDEVAERLSEDRTTVANYLRVLELSEPIQALIADGHVGMGHARCLLGVTSEARRIQLAASIASNELSVRALEEIVRRERTRHYEEKGAATGRPQPRVTHIEDLQRRFEQAVKTKVRIQEGKRKGTGRITIEYYSFDDFDRISELLGVAAE